VCSGGQPTGAWVLVTRWFGAVNPRDADVLIRDEGEHLVFNGRKSFSTGSKVSDVTVLEGVLEGTNTHVFAIVPSNQPGLTFHDDWDNIGQRLTESGSVTITEVQVPWSDAAHYTRTRTRPWLHGGHNKAVDEPYILDTYSDLAAKLWAVEALADQVADEALAIHRDPGAVTERARGDHEVRVAAVKARATDVALEITGRIFEVTGARSTTAALGLDRHWRNVRTHTLHDPVAYKRLEIGAFLLRDEIPEPTWYS
jgi:alkylation response protein AidB-like acyl-CoA dehydrogenase